MDEVERIDKIELGKLDELSRYGKNKKIRHIE